MENFWEMFEQELQKDGDHLVKGLIAKEIGRWHNISTLSAEIAQLCNGTMEFINKLITEEILWIKEEIWTRGKQAKFEENYHKQNDSIWETLRLIEARAYINILNIPETESYKRARKSLQTICNILLVQIELWIIISDDSIDTTQYQNTESLKP